MAETIRWGILGIGARAARFASALQAARHAEPLAVFATDPEQANTFGERLEIPRRHDSFKSFAEDPKIDAVYVVSSPTERGKDCLALLRSGKSVVCERPMAASLEEARAIVDAASQERKFFLEAIPSRGLPIIRQARSWVREEEIGEARLVQVNRGGRTALCGGTRRIRRRPRRP